MTVASDGSQLIFWPGRPADEEDIALHGVRQADIARNCPESWVLFADPQAPAWVTVMRSPNPEVACVTGASRAKILAHHGVQLCPMSGRRSDQERGLELATLILARYRSHSVFGRGRKWPLN